MPIRMTWLSAASRHGLPVSSRYMIADQPGQVQPRLLTADLRAVSLGSSRRGGSPVIRHLSQVHDPAVRGLTMWSFIRLPCLLGGAFVAAFLALAPGFTMG